MPIYEIAVGGKEYEVDAPDQEAAIAALGLVNQGTTLAEDIQGAGTKLLTGMLGSWGEEAAAGMRAGIGYSIANLIGAAEKITGEGEYQKTFEDKFGDTLSEVYDTMVADQRDVEKRFAEENPYLATGLELAGGMMTGGLVGKGALAGAQALRGAQGTTRLTNALVSGAAGAAEGAVYAIGSKEGTFTERLDDLEASDALFVGLGAAAGAGAGALVRGTSVSSAPMKEIAFNAAGKLGAAARIPGAAVKEVAGSIGDLAYYAGSRIAPELTEDVTTKAASVLSKLSDVTQEIKPMLPPLREKAMMGFNKAFQPVYKYAEKAVNKEFAGRTLRGAINGQRAVGRVDKLFKDNGMFELREALEGNELAKSALADFANAELPQAARDRGLVTLKNSLGNDELYNNFVKFVDAQEAFLDDIAVGVQSFKRTKGYFSVAGDRNQDLATESLLRERTASEAKMKLSTLDPSAKPKKALSRLNQDGSGLSSYGAKYKIKNPIDSHHLWMRSHSMLNETNKVLGLRGATSLAEMEEVAKGGFFQNQLKQRLLDRGYSTQKAENAAEIYNQVVWGSQRSMSKELQTLRNLGYATTIANPYGAFLQFHDLFNAAWAKGSKEMFDALAKKNGFEISAEDVGLMKQMYNEALSTGSVGGASQNKATEWLARRSADLLDYAMESKLSRFAELDRWSKGKIMSASLGKEFNLLAKDPDAWRNQWRFTFDNAELDELQAALKAKNTDNELVKQLALINLSDLQPISPASASLYQLSLPNMRIAYMLKGFAMTQLQLMRTLVFNELRRKDGNRKEALKKMMGYFFISGGGYGLVNETRQLIKLQAPDYGNVPTLAFYQVASIPTLGASGGNQYGMYKFTEDPVAAGIAHFAPPVPYLAGPAKDIMNLLTKGDPVPDQTLRSLPVIGPYAQELGKMLE